jgi:exoribonuclease R
MLKTKDYKHFTVIYPDGRVSTFEGAGSAKPALPGDIVEMKDDIVSSVKERVKHGPLVGVLELASKIRFGMTSRNIPIYRFTPLQQAYPPFFVGCSQKDTSKNMLVLVAFSEWDKGTCPRGNLVQLFGPCGDISSEEQALLADACLTSWKKAETENISVPPEIPGIFTTFGETFHIDPPGCKDIDDAITIRTIIDALVEVKIHIADVASWILANPSLKKAAEIGQTYYKDGMAVKPMFPSHLSEDTFSLLPRQERQTVTLSFIWDTVEKRISSSPTWTIEKTTVQLSYTYITVYKSPYAPILREITSCLAGRDITDSHEWVEQLMLYYNRTAAHILKGVGRGVLRRHAGKDLTRYAALEAIGLPADKLAMYGGEYCLCTDTDTQHWGLGLDIYCHATSPIRRWSDCINQIILRRHILPNGVALLPDDIDAVDALNKSSKRVKAFERDVHFARLLLGGIPNEPMDAIITEITDIKTRLWIPLWNRIITSYSVQEGSKPGDKVVATFFADPTQRAWKRRIVVRFST